MKPRKGDDGAPGGAPQKISLLDLRRAQTVGIMLSRFKPPLDAVARAIRRMDARALTNEDVLALRSYLPTDDEVTVLENYTGDPMNLAPPDLHFWHLMHVPLLQRRLDAFAYLLSFDTRVRALRSSIKNIQVLSVLLSLGVVPPCMVYSVALFTACCIGAVVCDVYDVRV